MCIKGVKSMNNNPIISLCLPTNGIIEWVFPVLDNIYNQKANINEWELIVTDNGNNNEFQEKMISYASEHDNLIYKKTNAYMFENQIEALRLASGHYLKFMNHRSILEPDSLQWMINTVKENIEEQPIMFFSNGVLKYSKREIFDSFDDFVKGLHEFASWTTGVGVWKSDFEKIPADWVYNKISPHSDVLFWIKDRDKYIIDDKVWSHDIDTSHAKKGKYDLYRAFGVEEISITLNLLNERYISPNTFKFILKCYEKCVAYFYMQFNILHQPCSYNLNGFDDAMGIFFKKRRVVMIAYIMLIKHFLSRIFHKK